jgi:glycosyltransferase involved in cell wall biosynthesis
MPQSPLVSIVLGSYNRRSFLKPTLESVRNNGMDFPYEIIVIDGGSTDGSLQYLAKQKDVITIIQHNRGNFRGRELSRRSWGYFMNLGFKITQGKYILMISDDCLLVPDAIKNGVKNFENEIANGKKIGAIAFYWRNWPEQQKYWVGLTLGEKMFVNHGLYLRSALEEVKWIDEDHYRFYHADGDICLKLWKNGYEVIDSKHSFVEHFTHANRKIKKENMILQKTDWHTYLSRWQNIYSIPDKDWLYLEYFDKTFTASSFPLSSRVRALIGLKAKNIWSTHIKPIICRLKGTTHE